MTANLWRKEFGRLTAVISMHRIAELRVVSDVESGVLPMIQVEERVIRGYARQKPWPLREVTLFVLDDLQPLARQLSHDTGMPPGGVIALEYRPVINVYDLAKPEACHVFVNRQAMEKEGYWNDQMATQALLAHEHAHPLAENETTRSLPWLEAAGGVIHQPAVSASGAGFLWPADRQDKIQRLMNILAEKLCLYAPARSSLNQMMIKRGFGQALLHLDRGNAATAAHSVEGRMGLELQLQAELKSGSLSPDGAAILLLIGDMRGYLDLAMEIAPFYRARQEGAASELDGVLEAAVFPFLEAPAPEQCIARSRQLYQALPDNFTAQAMQDSGKRVLAVMWEPMRDKGLGLRDRWTMTQQ